MIRLFAGYDEREAIGYHVFCASVMRRASEPVSIAAIGKNVSGTDGTNAFSVARFKVPALCNFEGWAIFADGSDMLCLEDIAKLWNLRDESKAVQVVKHDYTPRSSRKYIGTDMEAEQAPYPRKNWSSLILWNCAHPTNQPREMTAPVMHRFSWLADDLIGELPKAWNWLAEEDNQSHPTNAKLVHWTNGAPFIPYYGSAPFADLWRTEYRGMLTSPAQVLEAA